MTPLHWSQLRWMARSPAHYRYYLDHPPKPTEAMRVGMFVHALLLGSERKFVVYDGVRRGKEWERFKLEHTGAEITTVKEQETAERIASAVTDHEAAFDLLLHNVCTEVPLAWKVGNQECAGRVDAMSLDRLVELKVTNNAHPATVEWHARKMGWLAQLAWYYDGLSDKPARVMLVAAESKPPYPVTVFQLSERALEYGQRTWRMLFEDLCGCEENDHWPAYSQATCLLDVPDDEAFSVTVDGEEVDL